MSTWKPAELVMIAEKGLLVFIAAKIFAPLALATVSASSFAQASPSSAKQDATLRINQLQVVGTHNSYHSGLSSGEKAYLESRDRRTAEALDYSHPPLPQQLSAGIRQIELDIFPDPAGGRFADPIAKEGSVIVDPNPDHEMESPGFKVLHLQKVDQGSTCRTLIRCLNQVHDWSQQNPNRLPLFILIECKSYRSVTPTGETHFEAMTPALFDALDKEILSVFRLSEIVTPTQVRGSHANLLDAIKDTGWPTLVAARGKIFFLLDNRDLAATYEQGHPSLQGRILFPNSVPETPDAAFVEMNDGPPEKIVQLVRQGYLVRTRADSDTMQARSNSTRRRDQAMSSGAQIVSTDYPPSEPARWTGYAVEFSRGHVARCNPENQPLGCKDDLLEPVQNP